MIGYKSFFSATGGAAAATAATSGQQRIVLTHSSHGWKLRLLLAHAHTDDRLHLFSMPPSLFLQLFWQLLTAAYLLVSYTPLARIS